MTKKMTTTGDPRLIQQDIEDVAQATPSLERLRGKRLLLTGGTGFIGSWLLEIIAHLNQRWGDEPCRVYLPTRDSQTFAQRAPHLASRPEFLFLPGDVRAFDFPDDACDVIIHAAASASPRVAAAAPLAISDTIVEGTRRMLAFAHRLHVERFLFVSSGAVYGVQPPDLERIPEDYRGGPDITSPRAGYAEAKRYAESLCALYADQYHLPITIARPFTFIGPYQDLDAGFAVTDFIRDGLRGQSLQIQGDGATMRSYCAAPDLARMLFGVLFDGQPGRPYNIGSDEPISIRELAQRVVRALDAPVTVHIARQAPPDRLPDRYVPDITRITTELGLRPRVPLDDALRQFVEWTASAQGGAE
jgi:nucleoside-diphosphate-sugar epimerase